jgi:hypothetical protein
VACSGKGKGGATFDAAYDELTGRPRRRKNAVETKLWVDKYTPAMYGELLSDEVCVPHTMEGRGAWG